MEWTLKIRDLTSGPLGNTKRAVAGLVTELGNLSRAEAKAQRDAMQFAMSMSRAEAQVGRTAATVARAAKEQARAQIAQLALKKSIERSEGGGIGSVLSSYSGSIPGGGALSGLAGAAAAAGPIGIAIAAMAAFAFMSVKATTAVVDFGIRGAEAFGRAAIAASDLRVRADLAFTALNAGGTTGLDRMLGMAGRYGTSIEQTFTGVRSFLAAGFNSKESDEWFGRMQDLGGIGIDQGAISRITLAMSQIKGAGKLQGDELRQLGETGLSVDTIWKNIAGVMGKTVAQVKALKDKGALGADDALRGIRGAIIQMTGSKEAGSLGATLASKTSEGFINRIGVLKATFMDAIVKDNKGTSGILTSLNGAVSGAFDWIKGPDGEKAIATIRGAFTWIKSGIDAAIPAGNRFLRGFIKELTGSLGMLDGKDPFAWLKSRDTLRFFFQLGRDAGILIGSLPRLVQSISRVADGLDRIGALVPVFRVLGGAAMGPLGPFIMMTAALVTVTEKGDKLRSLIPTFGAIASAAGAPLAPLMLIAGAITAINAAAGSMQVDKILTGLSGARPAGTPGASVTPSLNSMVLRANDSGGVVTGIRNGIATVSAAPGEGLASIGSGEQIVSRGANGQVNYITFQYNGERTSGSDEDFLSKVLRELSYTAV